MFCVLAAGEDRVASGGWRGEAAPWSRRTFGGVRRGTWEEPSEREGLREAAMAAVEGEMGGHGSTEEGCVYHRRCFLTQSPLFT